MKYLLYFFMLANLVLFLWHRSIPDSNNALRPPAEIRQEQLQLLAESGLQNVVAPAPEAAVSGERPEPATQTSSRSGSRREAPPEVAPAAAPTCYTLGPFEEERQQAIDRRLRELANTVQPRQITEQEQYGYQVFIPPLSSIARARRVAARLKSKGLNDYFIMTGDSNRNGISLGLFREKRYASRHLEFVKKQGFDAVLEPRYRERVRFWFNYRDDRDRVDTGVLRELSGDRPVQRLQHDCRGLL